MVGRGFIIMALLTLFSWGASNPIPTGTATFSDNFHEGKLDTSKWNVAQWKAADTRPGINVGGYGSARFTQVTKRRCRADSAKRRHAPADGIRGNQQSRG
jgi:hypothetical protein